MKIELGQLSPEVPAVQVGFGECFLWDGELYIVTNGAFSSHFDGPFPVRIVSLRTGAENGISFDRNVIPVKVKCVEDCQ